MVDEGCCIPRRGDDDSIEGGGGGDDGHEHLNSYKLISLVMPKKQRAQTK